MAVTVASNFTFSPQIAGMYTSAYFRKELVLLQFAWMPKNDSFEKAQGKRYTFPFFRKLGAAEDGAENVALAVDDLGDSSFTTDIAEIGKATGITDTARLSMGCSHREWEEEAHKQLGRVLAEKAEADLWTEISKDASRDALTSPSGDITLSDAFTGLKGTDTNEFRAQEFNIRAFSKDLTAGFGDKRREVAAVIMHSQHYNSIETDIQAGFLKADANDPLHKVPGFIGRTGMFFNIPIFLNDGVPEGADITVTDSASASQDYKTYSVVYLKKNAYGFIPKRAAKVEYARNILTRRDEIAATQWYALRSFHKAIDTEDVRIVMKRYTVAQEA